MKEYMKFLGQKQLFIAINSSFPHALNFSVQGSEGKADVTLPVKQEFLVLQERSTGSMNLELYMESGHLPPPTEESARNVYCLLSYIPLKDKCMALCFITL